MSEFEIIVPDDVSETFLRTNMEAEDEDEASETSSQSKPENEDIELKLVDYDSETSSRNKPDHGEELDEENISPFQDITEPSPQAQEENAEETDYKPFDVLETTTQSKPDNEDIEMKSFDELLVILPQNQEHNKVLEVKYKNLKLKRKLIRKVRKQRAIYDTNCKCFYSRDAKEKAWRQIAKEMGKKVDACKIVWFDLRIMYQSYVRKLRKFIRSGNKNFNIRPIMALERDLDFLWKFISDCARCPKPLTSKTVEVEPAADDDDVVLLEDDAVEVIDLDEKESPGKSKPFSGSMRLTLEMRKFIEALQQYPELYDTENRYFNDHRRRGVIWNALANELKDKATKLMKLWIHLQARYEYEINHSTSGTKEEESDLQKALSFLKLYVLKNPNTVYKQSFFNQQHWQEPIEHFKNIFQLLVAIRKYPNIVNCTDESLLATVKDQEYITAWVDIAKIKGASPGQCEITWLIMRFFYWELMLMRKNSYQLQDKWYFESIITELYTHAAPAKLQQVDETKPADTEMHSNCYASLSPITVDLDGDDYTAYNVPSGASCAMLPKITSAKSLNVSAHPSFACQEKRTSFNTIPGVPATIKPVFPHGISLVPAIAPASLMLQMPTLLKPQNLLQSFNNDTSISLFNKATPSAAPMQLQISSAYSTAQAVPVQISAASNSSASMQIQAPSPPPVSKPYQNASISQQAASTSSPTMQLKISSVYSASSPTLPGIPPLHPLPGCNPSTSQPNHYNQNLQLNQCFRSVQSKLTNQFSQATQSQQANQSFQTPQSHQTNQSHKSILPKQQNQTMLNKQPVQSSQIDQPTPINQTQINQTPFNQSPLPKITGALSLLNQNEIMIELIATPSGNQLVVHGPPLSEKYSLDMRTTARFIREVMAIPKLHSKHTQASATNIYWQYLSKKFNLPSHICKACWNFLAENFNHFHQIAPMQELMKPFKTSIKVWKVSTELFKKFEALAAERGWLKYRNELPELMTQMSSFQEIFDVVSSQKQPTIPVHILSMYAHIPDIVHICTAFKNVFLAYMSDLENSVDNKWPQTWWRVLEKLKFLVEKRFKDNTAFFYIIRNKIEEEIQRCSVREKFMLLDKKNNQLSNDREDVISKASIKLISPAPIKPLSAPPTPSSDSVLVEPPPQKSLDLYALMVCISEHPNIYLSCSDWKKAEAWQEVSRKMNATENDCHIAFIHAVKEYRNFVHRDPVSRCRINHKYFKPLSNIYRTVHSGKKLNIKTPSEVNMTVTNAIDKHENEIVFPERFIMEINMENSKPALVMKNWVYGIGNLPVGTQMAMENTLRTLFNKYRNHVL